MILNITIIAIFALVFKVLGHAADPIILLLTVVPIILGLIFFMGTCVGLLRLPDFYTRLHAAGKGDTLSSVLILAGCAVWALHQGHISMGAILASIKILIIMNFVFIGSPTATHAMMDAGYETEVKHWEKPESEGKAV